MESGNEGMSNAFDAHLNIIEAILADIKENPSTCSGDGATLDFFWIKICLAVQTISKDATCIMMMFSSPPAPELKECLPMLKKLEGDSVALLSAFYSLPVSAGLTLKKRIHRSVQDVVTAIHGLLHTIKQQNFNSTQEQLQKTGNVWEVCDRFPSLPRDNTSAVLESTSQVLGLVTDALREVEEAQKEASEANYDWDDFVQEGEMDEGPLWSEADKKVMAPALGLVKATKAALKKTATVLKNQKNSPDAHQAAAELDDIGECAGRLSPAVDDLVACLYPPMQHSAVKENGKTLSSVMRNQLDLLRASTLTQAVDETWLNFLTQAIDHNYEKLRELVPGD